MEYEIHSGLRQPAEVIPILHLTVHCSLHSDVFRLRMVCSFPFALKPSILVLNFSFYLGADYESPYLR